MVSGQHNGQRSTDSDSYNCNNHRHYKSNDRHGRNTGRVAVVCVTREDAGAVDAVVVWICHILTRVEHVARTTESSCSNDACIHSNHPHHPQQSLAYSTAITHSHHPPTSSTGIIYIIHSNHPHHLQQSFTSSTVITRIIHSNHLHHPQKSLASSAAIIYIIHSNPQQSCASFTAITHNRQLPQHTRRLTDCNFITGMLYRDSY